MTTKSHTGDSDLTKLYSSLILSNISVMLQPHLINLMLNFHSETEFGIFSLLGQIRIATLRFLLAHRIQERFCFCNAGGWFLTFAIYMSTFLRLMFCLIWKPKTEIDTDTFNALLYLQLASLVVPTFY